MSVSVTVYDSNRIQINFDSYGIMRQVASIVITLEELRQINATVSEVLDEERWNLILIDPRLSAIGAS